MSDTATPIVMIVASDARFIYLMRYYTERSGHLAIVAPIDEQVAAVAEKSRPALIVLEADLMLAASADAFRALKTNGATRDIPVVVCSWPEGGPCALAEEADSYLEKPVSYEGFLVALRDVADLSAL